MNTELLRRMFFNDLATFNLLGIKLTADQKFCGIPKKKKCGESTGPWTSLSTSHQISGA